MASRRSRGSWGACAAIIVAVAAGYAYLDQTDEPPAAAAPAPVDLASAAEMHATLETLEVVEHIDVPGYDRDCSSGDECVFGPAWTDDTNAPLGRNGCDTRNDMLAIDLDDHVIGADGCVVESGVLTDPYTGEVVDFSRTDNANEIHIDHLVPLRYAWNAGAAEWDPETRASFANDPANLVTTQGSVNMAKSDSGPADWMPERDQCGYATRWVSVSAAYGLSITPGDRDVLAGACPVDETVG